MVRNWRLWCAGLLQPALIVSGALILETQVVWKGEIIIDEQTYRVCVTKQREVYVAGSLAPVVLREGNGGVEAIHTLIARGHAPLRSHCLATPQQEKTFHHFF